MREIILGDKDFHGYLIIAKKPTIEYTSTVLHWDHKIDGKPLSFFRFYYYGVDIYFDMEHRSMIIPDDFPNEQANILRF